MRRIIATGWGRLGVLGWLGWAVYCWNEVDEHVLFGRWRGKDYWLFSLYSLTVPLVIGSAVWWVYRGFRPPRADQREGGGGP
jgi:hypothetical protein